MGESYQIKDQFQPYFLTFQVVGWADVFSRKIYRDIIIESFEYCRKHKELEIYAYVIMTNHLHVIFRSKNGTLSNTVRDFKKFTAGKILTEIEKSNTESRREWLKMIFEYHAKFNERVGEMQFWTHENHAVELSDDRMLEGKMEYIHLNPVRAGWVENPEDYLYSSARSISNLTAVLKVDAT